MIAWWWLLVEPVALLALLFVVGWLRIEARRGIGGGTCPVTTKPQGGGYRPAPGPGGPGNPPNQGSGGFRRDLPPECRTSSGVCRYSGCAAHGACLGDVMPPSRRDGDRRVRR